MTHALMPAPPAARPMRRDAAQNYERVLAAAREVLNEHGTNATMELIAARAGVGVGTVYRRFPTKDALIDELVRLNVSDLVAAARRATTEEGGTGLRTFLFALGRSFTEHREYAHLLVDRAPAECGADDSARPDRRIARHRPSERTSRARHHAGGRPGHDLGHPRHRRVQWRRDSAGLATPPGPATACTQRCRRAERTYRRSTRANCDASPRAEPQTEPGPQCRSRGTARPPAEDCTESGA